MELVAVYGTVPYGSLPKPTRSGYTFLGWYTDKKYGTKVASTSPVRKDTTLYAHWEAENLAITKQPTTCEVNENSTAVFEVTATGAGLKYKWQYRTSATATWQNCTSKTVGYNSYQLQVGATTTRNGYQYQCIIKAPAGGTLTSNTVTLTVSASPVIVTQPTNQTAVYGSYAYFECRASGPELTYQWQYKASSTASWKDCTDQTDGYDEPCLAVYATAARNGYQYRCKVADNNGRTLTSTAAKLSVVDWKITTQPSTVYTNEGETGVFKVKATGTGLTYQWQYCQNWTESPVWKNCTSKTKGYNTATLSVEAAIGRHGYAYRCIVTDSSGKSRISDFGYLKINGMDPELDPDVDENPD